MQEFLPYFWEKGGTGDIRNIVRAFEVAKSASSLSMHNPGRKSWEQATGSKDGNLEQTFLVYVHGQCVQGSRWVEYLEEEVNHHYLACWCCMRLEGFVGGILCCCKQMGSRYSKDNSTFSKSINWGSSAVQLAKISISPRLGGMEDFTCKAMLIVWRIFVIELNVRRRNRDKEWEYKVIWSIFISLWTKAWYKRKIWRFNPSTKFCIHDIIRTTPVASRPADIIRGNTHSSGRDAIQM
jgi:hypothetical protein